MSKSVLCLRLRQLQICINFVFRLAGKTSQIRWCTAGKKEHQYGSNCSTEWNYNTVTKTIMTSLFCMFGTHMAAFPARMHVQYTLIYPFRFLPVRATSEMALEMLTFTGKNQQKIVFTLTSCIQYLIWLSAELPKKNLSLFYFYY